jgi:hypothetical protein
MLRHDRPVGARSRRQEHEEESWHVSDAMLSNSFLRTRLKRQPEKDPLSMGAEDVHRGSPQRAKRVDRRVCTFARAFCWRRGERERDTNAGAWRVWQCWVQQRTHHHVSAAESRMQSGNVTAVHRGRTISDAAGGRCLPIPGRGPEEARTQYQGESMSRILCGQFLIVRIILNGQCDGGSRLRHSRASREATRTSPRA